MTVSDHILGGGHVRGSSDIGGQRREQGARINQIPTRVVVLSGGGIASTVLAYLAVRRGTETVLVSINLGGRILGITSAAATAQRLRCAHRTADLSDVVQTLGPSPRRAARSTARRTGRPPIANHLRILVELGILAAAQWGSVAVLLGVHFDDVLVDPAVAGSGALVRAPLEHLTIGEVVSLGATLDVPWEQTHSCEQNLPQHCGTCGGCRRRRGGFAAAGIADPTPYLRSATRVW
jgi:7-cyano-7-deazaguanine synthase